MTHRVNTRRKFGEAGSPLFREHPWRITPRDIFIPLLST